jgi:hypothetical protein
VNIKVREVRFNKGALQKRLVDSMSHALSKTADSAANDLRTSFDTPHGIHGPPTTWHGGLRNSVATSKLDDMLYKVSVDAEYASEVAEGKNTYQPFYAKDGERTLLGEWAIDRGLPESLKGLYVVEAHPFIPQIRDKYAGIEGVNIFKNYLRGR